MKGADDYPPVSPYRVGCLAARTVLLSLSGSSRHSSPLASNRVVLCSASNHNMDRRCLKQMQTLFEDILHV